MTRGAALVPSLAVACLLAAGCSSAPSGGKLPRRERLQGLPEEERVWLTDFVAPIILPEEEKLFLELTEPHQRERFKREFWARREREGLPPPLGPGYAVRYAELRRLADETYDGWRSDAGRMVLRYGEPSEIRKVRYCEHVFRDLEVWTYAQGAGSIVSFLFYRFAELQPRKLWDVRVPNSEIFAPDSCRQRLADLVMDCPGSFQPTDRCKGPVCPQACDVYGLYRQIVERQHNALGAEQERARLLAPVQISTEGIEGLKAVSATAAATGARPLSVTGPSATPVKASRKALLADLPEDERVWLTDFVSPIIRPAEEQLFLELTEDYQRQIFKKDFWERRERDGLPPPFGPGFQRRYEELRPRLDSEYDGWRQDAARLVLHYGEPAEIRRTEGCNQSVFRDLEIWTMQNITGTYRQTVHHLFYRPSPVSPRKLWVTETTALDRSAAGGKPCQGSSSSPDNKLFQPSSCRKDLESLFCDCTPQLHDPCSGPGVCPEACEVYQIYREILARQGNPLGGIMETARALAVPEISTEGLDGLRTRLAAVSDAKAKPLSVGGPSARPAPGPTPTPEPKRLLSPEEIRDRIVQLEPKYRQFLELAGPLLTEVELSDFLQLTSREKDRFVREFWKKRK